MQSGSDTRFFPENVRADIVDRIHRFDKDLVYPIFAGAETLLRELGRLNIPVALVTSSDPEKWTVFSVFIHRFAHTSSNYKWLYGEPKQA